MGLIGLVIASVVNIFLASSALSFAISVIGVLVFAGLTAWDTQRLKEMYLYSDLDSESAAKLSVNGALSLYLNFVNMFQMLLSLFGSKQE
jgi:FtsH-binding integral membrane protein